MSSDTTLSLTSFSDSTGVEDDPGYRKCSLSTSNISLAKSILVLNSLTLTNQHLPHGVGESSHHERPARGEVHYGDREELGPLESPVGVAVDPVVLRGSRPSPWSVVVHGVVYDDDLTLHQPRQDLQSLHASSSSPNAPSVHVPTRTSRPRSSCWPSHLPGP